jgi:hypothetical protein
MKKKIIGIASLPERIECLKDTINSLLPQCDKIILGLNNYTSIPEFVINPKIESYILDNKLGDAAKFYKVQDYINDYYLTCDDDIIYPNDYVDYMIYKTNEYEKPVGLHGATIQHPITSMYTNRKVYHFLDDINEDVEVDYVGTGLMCYDTKKLKVHINDFKHANMADIWFGDIMYKNKIKPIVVAHKQNYVTYNKKMVENKINTIFKEYVITRNDKIQTDVVKKWLKY